MNDSPFDLTGKMFLVTGASSGIGRQICIGISQMGGSVVAVGRNAEKLSETESLLKEGRHIFFSADLSIEEERLALIEKLPKLNGIVYSAGVFASLPIKFINKEKLNSVYGINYEAAAFLVQTVLKKKLIEPNSSIVFISSVASFIGAPGNALYAGSKAALNAFSRALALEVAKSKTRVNCVLPGIVKTPMTETINQQLSKEMIAEDEKKYPLGYGLPEDIANAVVFLLSDASRWITGTSLVIDGGLTIQ